jgi:threonyl-tRNA synthetase
LKKLKNVTIKIGKALDLFHIQEEAQVWCFGMPMAGRFIKFLNNTCVKFSKTMVTKIKTPQIVDFSLWKNQDMQQTMLKTCLRHSESRNYAVKPMNCPCHVQVFNQG